jgi:hypothetical protein
MRTEEEICEEKSQKKVKFVLRQQRELCLQL